MKRNPRDHYRILAKTKNWSWRDLNISIHRGLVEPQSSSAPLGPFPARLLEVSCTNSKLSKKLFIPPSLPPPLTISMKAPEEFVRSSLSARQTPVASCRNRRHFPFNG